MVFNVKYDNQISYFALFILHSVSFETIFFSRIDRDPFAERKNKVFVKESDDSIVSCKRIEEIQLDLVNEMMVSSSEERMRFGLNLNDEISGLFERVQ